VGQAIGRSLQRLGKVPRREARAETLRLLREVQLDEALADRLPRQLSGGQKQRVAIARALAARSRLVICDEPTSALDVSVQARFLDLLQTLQQELRFACLFISHDLAVVDMLSHRIAVMSKGRLVEVGTPDQILRHPKDPYTQRLIAAVPVPDPTEQRERRESRRVA
jgi:peptide/nickel transport system ATP-binding protein